MHDLLCTNIKLTRRVLTKNVLKRIMNLNVGTNEVEKFAASVSKQNVRKGRNVKLINYTMRTKVSDSEFDEKTVRQEFVQKSVEYSRLTIKGSDVDKEFRRLMKNEVEMVWNEGKLKNKKKIMHLMSKYTPEEVYDKVRDVVFPALLRSLVQWYFGINIVIDVCFFVKIRQ